MQKPTLPSDDSEKTKVWQRIPNWLFGSLTIPTIVEITLSAVFIITNIFGDVTENDINSFYTIYRPEQTIGDDELSPLAALNGAGEFKFLKACHVPGFKTSAISADDIYLTNWFGESMHAVLQLTETIIGLFYEVHLSTSVQAVAQLVRDPNFGIHHVNMLVGSIPRPTQFTATDQAMNQKQCGDAVLAEFDLGNYVCEIDRIYLDLTSRKLVGSHIYRFCITPANAKAVIIAPNPVYPFRTRVKLFLGLLTERHS